MKCRYRVGEGEILSSPSPRRAWIEILLPSLSARAVGGRPPHGGRGLKLLPQGQQRGCAQSPSPRRAWIEILPVNEVRSSDFVALPTEGVD